MISDPACIIRDRTVYCIVRAARAFVRESWNTPAGEGDLTNFAWRNCQETLKIERPSYMSVTGASVRPTRHIHLHHHQGIID